MIDVEFFDDYKWYRVWFGDSYLLINNWINVVLYDLDGDVWFVMDYGISCFYLLIGLWNWIVMFFFCQMYIVLCEVKLGEICVGNYVYGLFFI